MTLTRKKNLNQQLHLILPLLVLQVKLVKECTFSSFILLKRKCIFGKGIVSIIIFIRVSFYK